LSMSGEELAPELGPLPPMKIHCSQLVEGALRSALKPGGGSEEASGTSAQGQGEGTEKQAPTLLDALTQHEKPASGRIVFLPMKDKGSEPS
jgi:nitrogen fixation protein NifU and related proteins